jgi:hypothetical protein
MKISFVVVGLPRSGTTWIANLLTTEETLCLPDPFASGLPESWETDGRITGVSCTGAHMFPNWLRSQNCQVAAIVRPQSECEKSAASIGLDWHNAVERAFPPVDALRVDYSDIWVEESAAELWRYLLPSIPFDRLRYRQLRRMQVQPYMPAWSYVPGIFEEMMRREAGG